MKNKLSLILAALLLGASALSCGNEAGNTPAETQKVDPSSDTEAVTEAVSTRPPVGLPEGLDFGGREFHSVAFTWQGYNYYFFADAENGDVMNDAIYHRRQKVEETLNVRIMTEVIQDVATTVVPTAVKKTVKAGEDAYDQVLLHCIDSVASLPSEGYLYNLDTLPNIDMDAEWWNQEQMDVLRLGKNTYYAINDFMVPCPYICYFNKDMVQNLDFDNPYELVYEGKWTIDRFSEMARAVVSDLNGDGKMTYEDDQFGITANETSKYASFLSASNQFIMSKGSDGKVGLSVNSEKTLHLVELFSVFKNEKVCYFPQKGEYGEDQLTINSGRLMFQLGTLALAEQMREYTVEFGFLPYPKYDEAQESYHSMDWGGLMCVPTTITNPEFTGAVIELLAYESGNEVLPTYYTTVLTGKLARDPDAEKMLDLIFDTICYDVGINYFGFTSGVSDLYNPIYNVALNGNGDFASFYAKREKNADKAITKFYESLESSESADS